MSNIKRILIHIPVGMLIPFLAAGVAIVFGAGFILYELNEDWHLNDQAYIDLQGFLIGITVGQVLCWIL